MSEGSESEDTTLLGTGTWTKQGPATLVLRENAWVVLVPGLRKQVIEAAWTVLGETPAPEDFLDRLVEVGELESAEKLTALLFGFHDGTRGVFGVKGKTPIAVYTAEGSQQIAGTENEPFVLRTLDGVRRTAFGELPLEDGLGAPRVETGIVPVRGFVHVTTDPAELEEDERLALAEQVEKDGRSIEDPEVKKRRAQRPAPAPASPVSTPPATRPATSTRATGGASSTASGGGAGSTASSRSSAAPAPESSAPNMFEGLFGGGAPAPDAAAPTTAGTSAPTTPAAPAGSAVAGAVTPQAPTPEPVSSPAPASSAPASPAASAPVPAGPDAPAADASSGPEAERPPAVRKRRLVSSSLFDRKSRSAPKETSPAPEPAAARPTPAEPPAPAPAQAPAAAPSRGESAASPAAPPPTSPISIPTPEAAEDEDALHPAAADEFVSPVTQVAPIDDEDGGEDQPAPTPAPRRAPAPRAPAPTTAGSDLENTGAYDDLFGKTVFRRIEDAAVRRDEDEEGDEGEESATAGPDTATAGPVASAEPADAEPVAGVAPAPEPEQPSAPSEFIDWVPGVGRTAPEIAQTAARRAAAPPTPESAYPQVHMAERPPVPNTGSRPAPTHPSMPPQEPAPYEQAGSYPPHGGPMNTGAAGQQLGYQARSGQPPQYSQGPVNSGAAGHQVGFPGAQTASAPGGAPGPQAPGGSGGRNAPGPGWGGSPNPPRHGVPPQQNRGRQQGVAPQPRQSSASSVPAVVGAGQAAGSAVALPGLVCARGHANSPERAACRFCGAPLQGTPRTVARPPLGVVLISGGDRFALDRTAIIGRRPRASRVSGNDVPQLITVPSPQQDISRSHLELRLEGWHVVALDLGTTNGTTLYREGFEPVRLRSREGVVLHDGDHLDLGDDVHLTFGERV